MTTAQTMLVTGWSAPGRQWLTLAWTAHADPEQLAAASRDSNDYRSVRNIVVIEGDLFDPDGTLEQQFRNRYDDDGAYIGGKTVFADGTVHED